MSKMTQMSQMCQKGHIGQMVQSMAYVEIFGLVEFSQDSLVKVRLCVKVGWLVCIKFKDDQSQ